MKHLKDIFYLLRNYKSKVVLNIFYILIFSVLAMFSFLAIVPFLDILFNADKAVPAEPLAGTMQFADYWKAWLDYKFALFLNEKGPVKTLLIVCVAIFIITLIKNAVLYLSLMNVGTLRAYVIRDIRKDLYDSIISLPLSFFSEERKGDLISRITNDVNEIEVSTIGVLNGILKAPIVIIISLTTLFLTSFKLTLFALIFLPISGIIISRVAKSVKGAAKKSKERLGEVLNIVEETLSGTRIIKAFNAQDSFTEKFDDKNNAYTRLMKKLYKREYLASPFSETLSFLVIIVLLYVGGQIVLDDSNSLTGGLFIFYLVVFSQLIQPAKELSQAFVKLNKGAASLERIREITHAENKLLDSPTAKEMPDFQNQIEFKNVAFSYDNEPFIKGLNFTIKKGETLALVGPSGGGKSTLANLLARFYDVTSGEVLIDGKPITSLKTKSLRANMGIVTQDSILFNDTVEYNITLGSDQVDKEKLKQALEISNAYEFVKDLDGKTKANVGESGGKLSGGQKQRLSIARAVYKNPPILVLDEATSALDTESEKLVQDAINKLMANRTSLVIAHRLSTIQNADRILVVKDGKIEEQGTHTELLAKNGVYKNLVDLQSL
ncbi:MAG: ABC transporter ATP-binding protein [Flavobacteriales bacterium]